MRLMHLIFIALIAGACASGSIADDERHVTDRDAACQPGDEVFCRCDDDAPGTRPCHADGEGFGSCVCGAQPPPDSPPDDAPPESPPEPEGEDVLLIPDSVTDSVGVYDAFDGTYLRDFIPPATGFEPYTLKTPLNAIQGPDDRIYLADQLADAIYAFEPDGTFAGVFADAGDGMDNIRGIEFFEGRLYVSSSGIHGWSVACFALDGTRLSDHVADDSNAFDVLFLANGLMLMADIADPDSVRRYADNGGGSVALFELAFPHQLQLLQDGVYLTTAWSGDEVISFDDTGPLTVIGDLPAATGVFPLSNGNWLVTSGDGVQAIEPQTGTVVATTRPGAGHKYIERAFLSH